jgi:tight adherence protein B
MNNTWITGFTFAATFLMVVSLISLIYDWLFRYRLAVRQRIRELNKDESHESSDDELVLFKDLKRLQDQEFRRRKPFNERLDDVFDQAGVQCTALMLAGWCLGLGAFAAMLGLWRGPWLALVAFPLGAAIPLLFLYTRRHFRRRALCRQLPEAFEMMSRAVRAGQTVPASLQIIAEDFQPPVSEEFQLCYEQQNLGMSRETALRKLAERAGIMELQLFVVALLVQARFGGDLAELLDNLASMIRKRFKLAERVRALTGEGRMQATVLIILPIAAFVAILFIAPDYVQTLLDRPWLLVGTFAIQVVGILWIRRIVSFEV